MTNWTAGDMPNLSGRVGIVTGANSGIGFYIALELARHGMQVTMAARDPGRGEDAVKRVRAAAPDANVELALLDLADLSSIRSFAQGWSTQHEGLDLLVNNAGVMAIPYRRTVDGFEMQFGVNHLGHFSLAGLLLPSLLIGEGARVVTVASGAHQRGRINFEDLQSEKGYRPWGAYSQSKLANLLFAFEFQRHIDAAQADLLSVAAHPGYAATNLQAVGPRMRGSRLQAMAMNLGNRFFAQPADQGALPELYAATSPDVVGGGYYGPGGRFERRGYPKRVIASRQAYDEAAAKRLWEVSEQLTGVTYRFIPPEPKSQLPDG